MIAKNVITDFTWLVHDVKSNIHNMSSWDEQWQQQWQKRE
jgi:hypothetical protein